STCHLQTYKSNCDSASGSQASKQSRASANCLGLLGDGRLARLPHPLFSATTAAVGADPHAPAAALPRLKSVDLALLCRTPDKPGRCNLQPAGQPAWHS